MTDSEQRASLRALMLATLAFCTCFYVWALFGPLSLRSSTIWASQKSSWAGWWRFRWSSAR